MTVPARMFRDTFRCMTIYIKLVRIAGGHMLAGRHGTWSWRSRCLRSDGKRGKKKKGLELVTNLQLVVEVPLGKTSFLFISSLPD